MRSLKTILLSIVVILRVASGKRIPVMLGLFLVSTGSCWGMLDAPYDTAPANTSGTGNSASRVEEGALWNADDQTTLIYWLGTDSTPPGTLIMDFANPFENGPGSDFAILTGDETWGIYAGPVTFDFYLNGNLQGSLNTQLLPNTLNEFALPSQVMLANRIDLINMGPNVGANNDADLEILDAGVRYSVPEPTPQLLFGLGGLIALCFAQKCGKHLASPQFQA